MGDVCREGRACYDLEMQSAASTVEAYIRSLPEDRRAAISAVREVILENLDLRQAPPGRYELIVLPLRLQGADGSPVRAVLRTP